MGSSMDGGLCLVTGDDRSECSRRISGDSGFQGGGRYHLLNQLVIASPSRERAIDGAGKGVGGTCGEVKIGDRSTPREEEGTTPQRLDRHGYKSDGRKNVPTTSPRPRGSVAASQSDPPPRVAVGPTVLVIDERQSQDGGGIAKVVGGSTPAYHRASMVKTHNASPSRSPIQPRSGPSLEAKATESNFHVHWGGLRSTPTSSSSSASTVVADDDACCRLASRVTERG